MRCCKCIYRCLDRCGGKPRLRKANNSHYWWTADCEYAKQQMRKVERKAARTQSRTQELIEEIKNTRNAYKGAVRFAKRQSFRELVEEINNTHDMSKITKIIRRTKRQEVGLLRRPDGTKCTNTEEVLRLLLTEHRENIT